jgi:IPT/TIG domain
VDTFVVTKWWAGIISFAVLVALLRIAHTLIAGRQTGAAAEEPLSRRRQRGVKALVMGADGRGSTSKLQVTLWTLAVLYALTFLMVWGRSIGCDGDELETRVCQEASGARAAFARTLEEPIDTEYYALLGLPTAAAIAARALTQNKLAKGEIRKRPIDADRAEGVEPDRAGKKDRGKEGVGKAIAEFVSTDDGRTDLIDFQYLAFNLIALAYFTFEFIATPSAGLPEIPPTLIGLTGVAVAAYTGKKTLEKDAAPTITAVIPDQLRVPSDTKVTVKGTGFGAQREAGKVLIDGTPVPRGQVSWGDDRIEVRLDPESLRSLLDVRRHRIVRIAVKDGKGSVSNEYPIELHEP